MSRLISRAEAWEKAYEAFSQINFTAFDYKTIKDSMQQYIRLYFPESFNDFIESSEFVAIMELFAYIGEQLIYRVDVGSHENFMSVAQRKQSVLRLAKLISYRVTRNIAARGLLKITSVATTEAVYDLRGNSIQGTKVLWNDLQNSAWKEQFTIILNAACSSKIGSVVPTERVQIDNVLFELYAFNNVYNTRGVLPYAVAAGGVTYPMEVVPVKLDQYGPSERRPEKNSALTFLYGSDGFGSDSPTTGFFLFTKQGRLANQQYTFDGKTPNQYIDLDPININDSDVWINNVDPVTGAILSNGDRSVSRSGEWNEVDTTSAQNVVFSYSNGKNRFETETLENDRVRVIFGDGEFANIPSGVFDIWYRTSANANTVIPQNAIADELFVMDYIDAQGQRQTLTFTASLISNVQNAAVTEDIEHIRRVAPATYYSQNRMVSGQDYNLFPLKDPSILKLRAINRTFAGESKFSAWYDASATYENVKHVGTDLAIILAEGSKTTTALDTTTPAKILANNIMPAIASNEMCVFMNSHHFSNNVSNIRRAITSEEGMNITVALTAMSVPGTIWITYNPIKDAFVAVTDRPAIDLIQVDRGVNGWSVKNKTASIVVESPTTNFWSVNNGAVISSDSLTASSDTITVLKANQTKFPGKLLSAPMQMVATSLVLDETGLQNVNKLEVAAYNSASTFTQGIDVLNQLIDPVWSIRPGSITDVMDMEINAIPPVVASKMRVNYDQIVLPFSYVKGMNEFTIIGLTPPMLDASGGYVGGDWCEDPAPAPGELTKIIHIYADVTYPVQVVKNSRIYQYRTNISSPFIHIDDTDEVRQVQAGEELKGVPDSARLYRRLRGVKDINFVWTHTAPSHNLIDPSFTNIHDVFVVQRGYYTNYLNWLNNITTEPALPSPLQLRNDYKQLVMNSMLSDTVIFHPGKLRLIIGSKAIPELQASILVVKNPSSVLTDSQIKLRVQTITKDFFDIMYWEFGETFYFTELAAVIHNEMASDINSVVLIPNNPNHFFGDMFQVNIQEDEIVQADIDIDDIEIVSSLNATKLRQFS